MARTANEIFAANVAYYVQKCIEAGLIDPITGNPLVDPSQWSKSDLQQLFFDTSANSESIFEQILDDYIGRIEAVAAVAVPITPPYIQDFVLNTFQYNATNPQILSLNKNSNFAPAYLDANGNVVSNDAYKIVTQCVVVPSALGITYVKVAKSGPVPLNSSELSSLQSALNLITIADRNIVASSTASDKVFIGGTVTYSGQYSAIIGTAVPNAIKTYLATIPTTGVAAINSPIGLMKLSDLVDAVKAVPGVIDFVLNNVNARQDGTAFVPGTYNLVSSNTELLSQYNSGLQGAGYMTTETAVGYTINDSLTYNAQ